MTFKFVFDTNALISAALLRNSVNAQALDHALNIGRLVISESALQEFEEVIFRKKFDKYFLNDPSGSPL
jgi:predicted nucleic acid-binding protein